MRRAYRKRQAVYLQVQIRIMPSWGTGRERRFEPRRGHRGHRAARQLGPGHVRVDRGVVLDQPVHEHVRLRSQTSAVASWTLSTSLPEPDAPVE